MLRNIVARNACRHRPSIQVARGLCRHQTRRLMASSPQFGKSYDSKQEKTAGFIMGILSMAGALYFITPNRKPLFASRKVESDKTAEEEISRGEEQSPDNGNGDESQTEAGAQLGGDQIGASKVAEDGELVVLADQDDNAAGEKEAVETKDDEQLRDGENKSEETKDSNESAEISEEGADAKSQDDHDIKSSKNTDFESLDEEKPEEAQSFDKETTKAADGEDEVKEQDHGDLESEKHPETSAEDKEALRKQEEKQMGATEEEVQHEGAYNPDTGEINWDCPCLGGMAHGPCGEEFKSAFSCFVYSEAEPKGIDCVEKFQHMQDCFRKYPEHYEDQLKETSDDEETQDKAKVNTMESAPNVSSAKENAEKKAEKSDVKKESLDEKA
ncbi:hypothetical protein SEUBUCD646_0K00340 [Saccharomyces eubayanus]|uniref:Mitochondrial intermembrane space import and assembly protein 40 n=2 Tax=Saccharomyces TaxID=4930 RepID=A0ABN8VFT1_SACEU|nr:hypothetical protein SEUBUCD650_0K00380 [Saccharomyces eubayanus]CAI1552185.1 hypothetical protein SEUBUCD646_0K00340 [Saccharomyces eubayanus]